MAAFLAQNYIVALEKARMRITEIEVIEITHTCCLLSAKVRERDIYCPMVSMIVQAGGNLVKPQSIKRREIEISHFYDWNIAMMCFYDFLEQFMFMGVVLESDQVKVLEDVGADEDMYRSPDVTRNDKQVEMIDDFKSPNNSNGSPDGKDGKKGDNSTQGGSNLQSPDHLGSMKTTPGGKLTQVGDLDPIKRETLIEKIERRCLDLGQ